MGLKPRYTLSGKRHGLKPVLRGVAILAVCVSGQPAVVARFEVASVKPSTADPGPYGIKTGHGRLDAKNVTLKQCIMSAYGVGRIKSRAVQSGWDRIDLRSRPKPINRPTMTLC